MKTTKKIVSALLCAAILLMGGCYTCRICERGGESEDKERYYRRHRF